MSCRITVLVAAAFLTTAIGCQTSHPYHAAKEKNWNHYGIDVCTPGPHVALGTLKGGETDVVVSGLVTETCKVSGCWATIDDGKDELIVLCEDSGFHLPGNCVGHDAVAHGRTEVRITPVDQLRHFAEVSGASPEEVAAITKPERMIVLIADSVFLKGDDLKRAYTHEEAEAACEAAGGAPDSMKK